MPHKSLLLPRPCVPADTPWFRLSPGEEDGETQNPTLRGPDICPKGQAQPPESCLQILERLVFAGGIKLALFVLRGRKRYRTKAWKTQVSDVSHLQEKMR